jgi:hypothetical protein
MIKMDHQLPALKDALGCSHNQMSQKARQAIAKTP